MGRELGIEQTDLQAQLEGQTKTRAEQTRVQHAKIACTKEYMNKYCQSIQLPSY